MLVCKVSISLSPYIYDSSWGKIVALRGFIRNAASMPQPVPTSLYSPLTLTAAPPQILALAPRRQRAQMHANGVQKSTPACGWRAQMHGNLACKSVRQRGASV